MPHQDPKCTRDRDGPPLKQVPPGRMSANEHNNFDVYCVTWDICNQDILSVITEQRFEACFRAIPVPGNEAPDCLVIALQNVGVPSVENIFQYHERKAKAMGKIWRDAVYIEASAVTDADQYLEVLLIQSLWRFREDVDADCIELHRQNARTKGTLVTRLALDYIGPLVVANFNLMRPGDEKKIKKLGRFGTLEMLPPDHPSRKSAALRSAPSGGSETGSRISGLSSLGSAAPPKARVSAAEATVASSSSGASSGSGSIDTSDMTSSSTVVGGDPNQIVTNVSAAVKKSVQPSNPRHALCHIHNLHLQKTFALCFRSKDPRKGTVRKPTENYYRENKFWIHTPHMRILLGGFNFEGNPLTNQDDWTRNRLDPFFYKHFQEAGRPKWNANSSLRRQNRKGQIDTTDLWGQRVFCANRGHMSCAGYKAVEGIDTLTSYNGSYVDLNLKMDKAIPSIPVVARFVHSKPAEIKNLQFKQDEVHNEICEHVQLGNLKAVQRGMHNQAEWKEDPRVIAAREKAEKEAEERALAAVKAAEKAQNDRMAAMFASGKIQVDAEKASEAARLEAERSEQEKRELEEATRQLEEEMAEAKAREMEAKHAERLAQLVEEERLEYERKQRQAERDAEEQERERQLREANLTKKEREKLEEEIRLGEERRRKEEEDDRLAEEERDRMEEEIRKKELEYQRWRALEDARLEKEEADRVLALQKSYRSPAEEAIAKAIEEARQKALAAGHQPGEADPKSLDSLEDGLQNDPTSAIERAERAEKEEQERKDREEREAREERERKEREAQESQERKIRELKEEAERIAIEEAKEKAKTEQERKELEELERQRQAEKEERDRKELEERKERDRREKQEKEERARKEQEEREERDRKEQEEREERERQKKERREERERERERKKKEREKELEKGRRKQEEEARKLEEERQRKWEEENGPPKNWRIVETGFNWQIRPLRKDKIKGSVTRENMRDAKRSVQRSLSPDQRGKIEKRQTQTQMTAVRSLERRASADGGDKTKSPQPVTKERSMQIGLSPTGTLTGPANHIVSAPSKPGSANTPYKGITQSGQVFYVQGSNLNSPGTNLNSPGTNLNSPGTNINSPGTKLNSPGTNLNSPGTNLNSPGTNLNLPGIDLSIPDIDPKPGHQVLASKKTGGEKHGVRGAKIDYSSEGPASIRDPTPNRASVARNRASATIPRLSDGEDPYHDEIEEHYRAPLEKPPRTPSPLTNKAVPPSSGLESGLESGQSGNDETQVKSSSRYLSPTGIISFATPKRSGFDYRNEEFDHQNAFAQSQERDYQNAGDSENGYHVAHYQNADDYQNQDSYQSGEFNESSAEVKIQVEQSLGRYSYDVTQSQQLQEGRVHFGRVQVKDIPGRTTNA